VVGCDSAAADERRFFFDIAVGISEQDNRAQTEWVGRLERAD